MPRRWQGCHSTGKVQAMAVQGSTLYMYLAGITWLFAFCVGRCTPWQSKQMLWHMLAFWLMNQSKLSCQHALSIVTPFHSTKCCHFCTCSTNRLLLNDLEKSANLMDKFSHLEPLEAVDCLAANMSQGQVRTTACPCCVAMYYTIM